MADSLKINPPPAKKKRREQSYSSKYGERIFSQVRKNKTDFRGSLSNDSLSSILVTKSFMEGKCCDQEFSADLLKRAKGATQAHVKPTQQ